MTTGAERLHALLIGIDDYESPEAADPGPGYPRLSGCVGDAIRVRTHLVENHAVPESQIETLLSPRPSGGLSAAPATYEQIVAAFAALSRRARPGDGVWIHYSGHGGRAPTAFPEIKGRKALDEALVPTDIAQADARYLRDVELTYLLERLVRRGLFVTLVLDCCHAGGVLREDLPPVPGAQARWNDVSAWSRPRASAVADREELERSWRRLAASRPSRESGRLLAVAGYTALLACRPFERAYEYEVEPGRKGGALTHFLLASLRTLGPRATYLDCFERLRGQMRGSLGGFQNPVLEGNAERRLLSAEIGAPSRGVTVLVREAERVLLAAGAAQGIEQGARFEIEPLLATSEATRTVVEVEEVSGAESWARPVSGWPDGTATPEPGDRALLCSLTPRRCTVCCPRELVAGSTSAPWQRLRDVLLSLESSWLAWSDRDDADLHLSIDHDGILRVSGRNGSPLEPPFPEGFGEGSDPRQLLKALEHVAHYRAVETLRNQDPSCPLQQAVHGELARLRPDFRPGEHPCEAVEVLGRSAAMEPDAWVALGLENRFDQPLDVVVIDLTSAWSIEQVYPATGDSHSLDPGERIQVPFRIAQVPGLASSRDRLKVFVTYDPVRFRWLELPPLGQPRRRERHTERPRHPLETQLAAWRSVMPSSAGELRDRFASREWLVFDLVIDILPPALAPQPP